MNVPGFKPVHIGHVFDDGARTGAVDALFREFGLEVPALMLASELSLRNN